MSTEQQEQVPDPVTERQIQTDRTITRSTMLIGLFWVIFCWNFWESGFAALGLNAAILLFFYMGLLLRGRLWPTRPLWVDPVWEVPVLLLILSYALYENPFYKACNIIALPAIFGFIILRKSASKSDYLFDDGIKLLYLICYAVFGPLGYIQRSFLAQWRWFTYSLSTFVRFRSPVARSVIKGISVFLLLAVLLIVPLLSAADSTFASVFEQFYLMIRDVIEAIFEKEFIWKLICLAGISLCVLTTFFAWHYDYSKSITRKDAAEHDSIAAAIILSGIMLLYLIFIAIQLEKLFLNMLPVNFPETEKYVKQGFWQLVFLSTINIYLVLIYFRRTTKQVQTILVSFTFVSLALLFSAAHRMLLYVSLHGLSYEKFYASYTVLYCVILFGLLLYAFFAANPRSILHDAVVVVIWMYAVVGVLPVEKCIVVFNQQMHARQGSRIDLEDMKMLSVDVLPYVQKHRQALEKTPHAQGSWSNVSQWIETTDKKLQKKRWFEHSLTSLWAVYSHR